VTPNLSTGVYIYYNNVLSEQIFNRETSTGGLRTAFWMKTILETSAWASTKFPITWTRRSLFRLPGTTEERRSTSSKVDKHLNMRIFLCDNVEDIYPTHRTMKVHLEPKMVLQSDAKEEPFLVPQRTFQTWVL